MWQITPSVFLRMSVILCREISGADDIPKGSQFIQKRPNGFKNDVRSLDSGSRVICQNPLMASSLVKTVDLERRTRSLSTDLSGWTSRRTALFRAVRSTQMRTLSFHYGTTTIAEHQYVGPSTGEMSPLCQHAVDFSFVFGK